MNQTAFFEALGWSLIDSLWQAGAIWFAYISITRNGSRFTSDQRHTLALTGIMLSTLLFFFSIIINGFSAASGGRIFSFAHYIEQQAGSFLHIYGQVSSIVSALPYIYLPVLTFFALRTLAQLTIHRGSYRKNILPAGNELSLLASSVCSRLGLEKETLVWLSSKIDGPLTIGFWKPVILLPIAVFSQLSYRQIEAVIAHELFHIKRNDYLLNIFLTFSETILFFNPFAKLLARIVKTERENRCDDSVIAAGFDAWEYSEALYILGKLRQQQGKFSIAATGPGKEYLLQRIRRIMNRKNPQPSLAKPVVAFFLCLLVAGFASRNTPVPVLAHPEPAKEISSVVYYSVEKQANVEELVVVAPTPKVKTRGLEQVEDVPLPPDNVPSPLDPPQPVDVLPADLPEPPAPLEAPDVIITSFVNASSDIEFTIIDQAEPEVPEVVCETPPPYVPKFTFYFTEVDTLAGKKVICL